MQTIITLSELPCFKISLFFIFQIGTRKQSASSFLISCWYIDPVIQVQQSYDPSTSYTPFYRPIADADGHVSPLLASSASSRYNGNTAVLPARTVQASQEVCV